MVSRLEEHLNMRNLFNFNFLNIFRLCSRMFRKNMRDTPGQQLSIYCIFQELTHPSLTGHFQFKVRNYGIVYPLTLETALLSIDSKAH